MSEIKIEFFEDLSGLEINCPHIDAFTPDGQKAYFRVIKENPATSDCFLPTPLKDGRPKPDDCILKSVSIFDNYDGLLNGYFRTPAHKKKLRNIAVLTLTSRCGLLKQTFAASHYSWWRSMEFQPENVSVTEVEK